MLLEFLFSLFLLVNPVFAHEPVTTQVTLTQSQVNNLTEDELYSKSLDLGDPSVQSVAAYGNLSKPNQISIYSFTPSKDGEISIEVLVPVRDRNKNFRPSYFVLAPSIKATTNEQLKITPPENYGIKVINQNSVREIFYEPFSLERLYKGTNINLVVKENTKYYVGVFEPNNYIGDYSLGVGTEENFKNVSKVKLLKEVLKVKMGLVGDVQVPWQKFFGTLFMVVGLIVGLGAVTVIDLLGFLGIHDTYWLKASISAHKVTKPLIWLGTVFLFIGAVILNWQGLFTGVALFQFILLLIMLINGSFLSFIVSPRLLKIEKQKLTTMDIELKKSVFVSFIISFVSWWAQVFLLVWNLIVF